VVASLLAHHSRAGAFLIAPPVLEALGVGATHASPLPADAKVGPYTVVREIAQGGMGRVYLATDLRLERQVCLKAVRTDLASTPGYRERLQREARLAASLSHPGICAVHALEELDGDLYLVTEYVDGRTLREEINSGQRPSADAVLTTMRELAEALAAAHARAITHRDLKPENVMRSASGQLKILDFGLARTDDGTPRTMVTATGAVLGTPAYMAPEQINGQPADRRADVFALGVLMYELATGTHPFTAPTPLATVARILEHDPEPLHQRRPDLPASVVASVERCLQKDPAARFGSAHEIVETLGSDRAEPPRTRRRTWWQLHHWFIVLLYLIACGAAWQLKEWEPSTAARSGFLLIGVLAAINGVIRGHLLFTEHAHPRRLAAERRRTRLISPGLDLAIALTLFAAASLASPTRPVAALLVMGLAAAIGTSAIFIEPATSAAAFDEP
jgi:serine/threonine-protein kinase